MKGQHGWSRDLLDERQRELFEVRVNHVEVACFGAPVNFSQQRQMRLYGVRLRPKSLRHRYKRLQVGARTRVATGKQRDVVAALDQGVRQLGDDTFGAAIALGGNSQVQ